MKRPPEFRDHRGVRLTWRGWLLLCATAVTFGYCTAPWVLIHG